MAGSTEPGGGTLAPSQTRDAGLPPEPVAPGPITPGDGSKPPSPNPIP